MKPIRTLLSRLAEALVPWPVPAPGAGPGTRPDTRPDEADFLAHPQIARMSLRELADLPLPR